MFLFLLLVLQPDLRAGEASLWFGATLAALALYTSATLDLQSIIYRSASVSPYVSLAICVYVCVSVCVRAALTRVPCWLQSDLFSRLHVSRYRRFPLGLGRHAG